MIKNYFVRSARLNTIYLCLAVTAAFTFTTARISVTVDDCLVSFPLAKCENDDVMEIVCAWFVSKPLILLDVKKCMWVWRPFILYEQRGEVADDKHVRIDFWLVSYSNLNSLFSKKEKVFTNRRKFQKETKLL